MGPEFFAKMNFKDSGRGLAAQNPGVLARSPHPCRDSYGAVVTRRSTLDLQRKIRALGPLVASVPRQLWSGRHSPQHARRLGNAQVRGPKSAPAAPSACFRARL
jgi:hypothetical protein